MASSASHAISALAELLVVFTEAVLGIRQCYLYVDLFAMLQQISSQQVATSHRVGGQSG